MRKVIILLLLIGNFNHGTSQTKNNYQKIDQDVKRLDSRFEKSIPVLAEWINHNIEQDSDKIRFIYGWLADRIVYDVDQLSRPAKGYSVQQKTERAFLQRRAVCEGYAGLMDSLCKLTGITSFRINGYTKQSGQINDIAHQWIAANIDGDWVLFDPTWGAGFVKNNKFTQSFDESFFKIAPQHFIKTHMPYDPIWQFLSNPISHSSFHKIEIKESKNRTIAFEDSINLYQNQKDIERWKKELHRITTDSKGKNFTALESRIDYLNESIKTAAYNDKIDALNRSTTLYNEASELYNEAVNHLKKRGRTTKNTKVLLKEAELLGKESYSILEKLKAPNKKMRKHQKKLIKNTKKLLDAIKKAKH